MVSIPKKVIKQFDVEYIQILNQDGEIDSSIDHGISEDKLKEMYHLMTLSRAFDEKLFKLQRSGKIGTYASANGQEACQVASVIELKKTDWFVPAFRELPGYITRGVERAKLVQAWNGDTRAFKGDSRDLPVAIPVGSQILTATGIGWGSKLQGTDDVTMVFFGDGATSEGDFHEGLNFAGEFKAPVIFMCQNNQWAISTPREKQTASETIAQKSIAYGIKGVQVDGNDVMAVNLAVREAVERARKGEGPTLIECLTYRFSDHTTSDDAKKYRDENEVDEWRKKDPIIRLRKHFEKIGTWSKEYEQWLEKENEKEVTQAVEKALAIEPRKPEDLFEHIYKELTPDLIEQKEFLAKEVEK